MKSKVIKEIAVALCVLVIFGAAAYAVSELFIPKRVDFGSTWGQFLKEPENSIDAVVLGSSIAYCDVAPPIIWEESGVSSYVMAGPEQTIPFSYYYLKEITKTQSPKLLLLEVTGMFFERYQDYTKVNLGYMPMGASRLEATFSAAESEEIPGLLFPPYDYHSRWTEMRKEDYEAALTPYCADPMAGYTFLSDAVPQTEATLRGEVFDEENYNKNLDYIRKIVDFCAEKGIKPVLFVAPTYWRLSEEHMKMLESDLGSIEGVRYYNYNDSPGVEAYDPNRDFYDSLHFNCYGAEKFSRFLAGELTGSFGLTPTENADTALWNVRAAAFHEKVNALGGAQ